MVGSLFFARTLKMIQKYHLSLSRRNLFLLYEAAGNRLQILSGVGMDTYLTVKEVAELVRLSVQTIRRYTMNKEIPFHKINRMVRYKKIEIEQWVEKREQAKADTLFNGNKSGGEV